MTHKTPNPKDVIGEQFSEDEVSGDESYAYFAPYGSFSDEFDEIHHLDEEGPMYATDDLLRIELEPVEDDGYEIVRAKNMDTSDPSSSFEWVEDDPEE